MTRNNFLTLIAAAGMFLSASVSANAATIDIKVENLVPANGFYFTPVWVGVHDGSFDVYSNGVAASAFPGLKELAEGGDTGPLSANFNSTTSGVDATILAPLGFAGAPVFDPGEVAHLSLNVADPTTNRFFSYASMVIPSNDAFFANGGPTDQMIFDTAGNFTGPIVIEVRGRHILDAGTEFNDINGGAAFSALGGTSVAEMNTILAHAGLTPFLTTNTVAGSTLGSDLHNSTLLARITIVPEPSSIVLSLTAFVGLLRRRRRR